MSDVDETTDWLPLPDDDEDEALNDEDAYDDVFSLAMNGTLSVEVVPMGPDETTCPACFLIVSRRLLRPGGLCADCD